MNSLGSQRTQKLKEAAIRHGFMGVGISKAERMDDEARGLESWLSKGYHGEMAYMANHFEMRIDPTKLMPGAKSVVSLMYNYFPGPLNPLAPPQSSFSARGKGTSTSSNTSQLTTDNSQFKISRYAYGEDYHHVIRKKLKAMVAELQQEIGEFHGRVFVDSAPVMERDWAKRSGQGWIGKNTLLIHPKKGSYFFLAEIILDIELDYDHPIRDHCGTCTKCIDACPTDAISPEGYILDGSKCISYLTIELKSQIPESFKGQMEDWIFGCDICQEVCPWNRFSTPHHESAFEMPEKISALKKEDWQEMTEDVFDVMFEKSPLRRPGFIGMKRNILYNSEKK